MSEYTNTELREDRTFKEVVQTPKMFKVGSLRRHIEMFFGDEYAKKTPPRYRGVVVYKSASRDGLREVFVDSGKQGFVNLVVTGTQEYGYTARLDEYQLRGEANILVNEGDEITYFATDEVIEPGDDATLGALNACIEYREAQHDQHTRVSRGIGKLFRR